MALKENLVVKDGRAYSQNGTDVSHMVEVTLKTTEQQVKGLETVENLAQHEEENGGFVFSFFKSCMTMEQQFPTLAQSDLARVMFIGTYAGWSTGELKHDNGVPINKKSLDELLGMSRNKFNTFYKSIVDCGIIAEQDGAIFMNPAHFFRGNMSEVKHITKDLQYTRLFRTTVRELYAMYNGRTIKQLAIIYAVLPFVNFNFNIIAFNPDEANKDLVKPIPLDKLAIMLGYADHRKFKKALNSIKYKDQSVFGFFEVNGDRRQKKTVINPRVIYAGNGKSLDGIQVLFN
jgi:hypothetical protein